LLSVNKKLSGIGIVDILYISAVKSCHHVYAVVTWSVYCGSKRPFHRHLWLCSILLSRISCTAPNYLVRWCACVLLSRATEIV